MGKTIIITGASYGIGEELAYLLGKNGAHLLLIGRTEKKLKIVHSTVKQNGGSSEVYPFDMRNEDSLNSFLSQLKKDNIIPHIFISNAGKSIQRSILESLDRFHDYERTMSLNYYAPVKLCLGLLPGILKNKGQIINISAINVLLPPVPKWSAYQASKTAFDQWFRTISPELRSKNVICSTMYLPLVRTRMIEPTKSYAKMPAMNPSHVAITCAKLILKRKKTYRPWWLGTVIFFAFVFKKPLEFLIDLKHKPKRND